MRVAPETAPADPRFSHPGTLFIGIGAQKSGTSWLSRYLERHPEVHHSRRKELHYWNVVRPPHDAFPRRRTEADRRRLDRAPGLAGIAQALRERTLDRRAHRRRMAWAGIYDGSDAHEAYADALFADWRGEGVAGEFTPAYARLSAETFAEIAALAPDVRFLFVMRDPAERLISGMRHRLRGEVGADRVTAGAVQARVRAALAGEEDGAEDGAEDGDVARSRYDRTITALEAAVPRERVFYAFFETLFRQAEMDRLCAFLGVAGRAADFAPVHVGGDRARLGPGFRQEVRAALDPVYGFVEDRFGTLPDGWRRPGVGAADGSGAGSPGDERV